MFILFFKPILPLHLLKAILFNWFLGSLLIRQYRCGQCGNGVNVVNKHTSHDIDTSESYFRCTPQPLASVLWWWSFVPALDAHSRAWPPTGWKTRLWWTTATKLRCPCMWGSPSFGSPLRPATLWWWSDRARGSHPSWAFCRSVPGSRSKVT